MEIGIRITRIQCNMKIATWNENVVNGRLSEPTQASAVGICLTLEFDFVTLDDAAIFEIN